MLTRPDRQTFEQIRARWEAAQLDEEKSVDMVGRKVSQQPASDDVQDSAGSKFRRKISHGLASISNTLSARKTTPGRQPPLPVTASVAPSASMRQCDAPLSPTPKSKSLSGHSTSSATKIAAPADPESPTKRVDAGATPKEMPRLRTTSFLPRPVKQDSEVSVSDLDRTVKVFSPVVFTDPKLRAMPSKIPTPSPPLSERRVQSPRQHFSHYKALQGKHRETSYAFSGNNAGSPAKFATKSRTTPNLVEGVNPPQPANFMAPRRPGAKRPITSPPVQKPTLQENIPMNKRAGQRYSQMVEKTPRRESLSVPTTVTSRRSFGPSSPLFQSKQSNGGTPLTAKKRTSSQLAPQTPLTARRAQPSGQVFVNVQESVSVASSGPIVQPRLMGPRNPPTPTPLNAEAAGASTSARLPLPRSNTDKDVQRKTLGTPNGLGGVWRSSRALAAANHEVRLLRSSTFHNFGRSWEAAPPVPPIPDQYRTPSLPHLLGASNMHPANPNRSQHLRMVSDAASCGSIPEENGEEPNVVHSMIATLKINTPSASPELSNSSDGLVTSTLLSGGEHSKPASLSTNCWSSQQSLLRSQNERPWSISSLHSAHRANTELDLQVRDYMPPLYWAGRFQSRYDQWRTEAMHAELDLKHRTEDQLSQCKLSQEKIAACHIFAQLHDLCLTGQAADSLWVFESRYRNDNKLLDNPDYPMRPPRKHEDQSAQKGAFGRAVRKLTPRKSSFVNLLTGKGWGKSDEVKPPEASEQTLGTCTSGS